MPLFLQDAMIFNEITQFDLIIERVCILLQQSQQKCALFEVIVKRHKLSASQGARLCAITELK